MSIDSASQLPLSTRVRLYFTDLSFFTQTQLGPSEATKRKLWLVACYLGFGLGVFGRQIVNLSDFPLIGLAYDRLNPSVLLGSMIVGLAIFPFVVRQVRKIADYMIAGSVEPSVQPAQAEAPGSPPGNTPPVENADLGKWNLIHVFASFSTGFFVNLAFEKAVEIVRTQLG